MNMNRKKILIIDNYDSFTWNIYHHVTESFLDVEVIRNNLIKKHAINDKKYLGIIISPGPGHPKKLHNVLDIIKSKINVIPILGICLGHQALGLAHGADIKRMKRVVHGQTDKIKIKKRDKLFNKVPETFLATRYHSLEIEKKTLPKEIEVLALSKYNHIMAIKIRNIFAYGVQFHPESIATNYGKLILKNFVKICLNARK